MNIPDKGNSHKKFVRSQTKFGFWGHIISMTGQFLYGEPFNVLKHKMKIIHLVNYYQGASKSNFLFHATGILTVQQPQSTFKYIPEFLFWFLG